MPLSRCFGLASGPGLCALTQTPVVRTQIRTAVNRQKLFASRIVETFQQGTFGPAEILKTSVAEETPGAKNCGVRTKMASKIQPSDCCLLELLFFESTGPLRITVEPDKVLSDDEYDTRPLPPTVAVVAGSLLNGELITWVL